jgi:hypothetical protein
MATKTIGLSGRDFATLAAWASYVNALSLSAPEVADVYNDSGAVADTVQVVVNGYTGESGTNTVTLKAASGQGFRDHANAATNPLRYDATKGAALTNNLGHAATGAYRFLGGFFTVSGLQLRATAGNSLGLFNRAVLIDGCLLDFAGTSGLKIDSATTTVQSSAVLHRGTGSAIELSGATSALTGVTVAKIGSVTGAGVSMTYGGTAVLKNTAVIGFTTDYSGTFSASCTNNATDKGTFGGTNVGTSGQVSITSADFESLTGGSEDLRVKSTSTKLIDTGATVGPSTDIIGQTRGATYDIGAWEYTAPASVLSGEAVLSGITADGSMAPQPDSSMSGAAVLAGITAEGGMGLAPGVITTPVLKNNTGTILASVSGIVANIYHPTTGALVVRKTGLTSDGSGIVTISDVLLVPATTYAYELDLSASTQGRRLPTGVAA